jgi:V/A-type H+/Na+-transporting ATPase subunit B
MPKLYRLNNNFAFVSGDQENFVNEKVILTCKDKKAFGRVIGIELDKHNIIEILSSVEGFDVDGTVVEYSRAGFESYLSPTILGRKFDGIGNPIDGDTQVIPVEIQKFEMPNIDPNSITMRDYTLDPLDITIGKYSRVKVTKEEDQIQKVIEILNNLTLDKVVIVISFLDSQRVNIDELDEALIKNQLLALTVQYHSTRPNKEILVTPELSLTTAKYLALELGFDVIYFVVDFENFRKVATEQNRLRGKILDIDYFDIISARYLERQVFALEEGKGSLTTIVLEESLE